MSGVGSSYPQPRRDRDNAVFLDGWAEGRLLLQRCRRCGNAFFYPRPICPSCWSADLVHEASAGRGRIVSWSAVERPNDLAFNGEIPILLAEVALDEGATLLARIVDCTRGSIRSGAAVVLPPVEVARRYPLPVFHIAGGAKP